MKKSIIVAGAFVALSMGMSASAQVSKSLTGETQVMTATVEAIEQSTRKVTLKEPDGSYTMVTAPPEMKRFSELKVGDKVTVRYYENIVLRLKEPGEKDVDTGTGATTRGTGANPGATVAEQRTITATITQLDQEAAVDHVHGAQRLDVQLARGRQEDAATRSRSATRSTSPGRRPRWCRSTTPQ